MAVGFERKTKGLCLLLTVLLVSGHSIAARHLLQTSADNPNPEIFAIADMSAMACLTDESLHITCGTQPDTVWSYNDQDGFSADWASVFMIVYTSPPVVGSDGSISYKAVLLGGPSKTAKYCRDSTDGIVCDVPIDSDILIGSPGSATVFVVTAPAAGRYIRTLYNYETGLWCSTEPVTYHVTCDVTDQKFDITYDAFWVVYGEEYTPDDSATSTNDSTTSITSTTAGTTSTTPTTGSSSSAAPFTPLNTTTTPSSSPMPVIQAPRGTRPFKGAKIVASNTLSALETQAAKNTTSTATGRNSTTSGSVIGSNTPAAASPRPQATITPAKSSAGGAGSGVNLIVGLVGSLAAMLALF